MCCDAVHFVLVEEMTVERIFTHTHTHTCLYLLSPHSPPPVWSSEDPQSSRKPHSPAGPSVSFAAIVADQEKETESQSRFDAKYFLCASYASYLT